MALINPQVSVHFYWGIHVDKLRAMLQYDLLLEQIVSSVGVAGVRVRSGVLPDRRRELGQVRLHRKLANVTTDVQVTLWQNAGWREAYEN